MNQTMAVKRNSQNWLESLQNLRPNRLPVVNLGLRDERKVVVDGSDFEITFGTGRAVTASALSVMVYGCTQRIIFRREGDGWKRLDKDAVIELEGDQSFRTEKPAVKTVPMTYTGD